MLQRLTIPGVELPRLYIAKNQKDVETAMDNGVPFIKWNRDPMDLVRHIIRPILEKKFPDILWDKFLGRKKRIESKVVICDKDGNDLDRIPNDLTKPISWYDPDKEPDFVPGVYEDGEAVDDIAAIPGDYEIVGADTQKGSVHTISISDYCGDLSACVNIDVLQTLNMLPSFIGNIVDCIKKNNQAVLWTEGYNKKLRQAVGNFNRGRELRNLIILDVSVSIPRGIAATMVNLIDTLRYQVNADLLITGGDSGFYRHGEELPDPDTMYAMYGGCNETFRFLKIMEKNVVGKEWGHVIAFGDTNLPSLEQSWFSWAGTRVHHVHHYHTMLQDMVGYAIWTDRLEKKPDKVEFNTDWCKVIRR